MDIVASNPEYEIEQTQKHHYRTFFQVKKTGTQGAFQQQVAGSPAEADNEPQSQPSPVTGGAGGAAQVQAQAQQQANDPNPVNNTPPSPEEEAPADKANKDKTDDPETPQPGQDGDNNKAQFPSMDNIPIKKTAVQQKGLTVEIGKDYSIAVKDKDGNAINRYRGKNPADIFRWISDNGYGGNRMKIVDKEQPSGDRELVPERVKEKVATSTFENFVVTGKAILMHSKIEANQAAMMNLIVNAPSVRLVDEGVEFAFETDRDMPFKKALVELAAKKTGAIV